MIRSTRTATAVGCAQGRAIVASILGILLLLDGAGAAAQTTHDRPFWVALRAARFELPQGTAALPLALEAAALLGST
ncbi:MAG: hypothetical protein ACTHL7_09670, partial [Steroidobacteraceae bacterium]